jgi:non-specific serine/threonine protein kinase
MATELAAGDELAGYRIEELVGRGGMGVVYRATQLSLDRQVALKLIVPERETEEAFRERFLREGRIAASLEHPNVLPVYEAGESGGQLYLALRYVDAADLATVLAEGGPLSPERARTIVAQIASALAAAHERGLLHRDVKPANVLVAEHAGAPHAYLTDFGLARLQGAAGPTRAGQIVGTLAFLAPELIAGREPDPRCDVYSLGCLLYECLVGEAPFVRQHEGALLYAHLREPPPPPSERRPDIGDAFDAIVLRALAKDPEERYQSARALAQALTEEPQTPAPQVAISAALPSNLPHPASSFLGRRGELRDVQALLDGGARLLTLTGPGGTGKTRLALATAAARVGTHEAGVCWVGLSALRDPALVAEAIARELGVSDGLAEHIADQELLLVLDNLEQVIDAAPELSRLLNACPNLTVLCTSRELLRIQGEVEYSVPPLAAAEAVDLFCARSALESSDEIADLCDQLDNLPLAVELAAARTRVLSPAQIVERLGARLDLLEGGRDADPRQRTLRATIGWSYDLLDEDEKRLFAGLSVFSGGCTLEAAEGIAEAQLDVLQSLVEKSLVRFSDGRYWMLETIREYAAERLADSGAAVLDLRRAHARWFIELARELSSTNDGDARVRLGTFERDHANFRSALEWCLELDEDDRGAALALDLSDFWLTRGHLREGRRWLEVWLERGQLPPERRLHVLHESSSIAIRQGDDSIDDLAGALLEASLEADDDRLVVQSLTKLAWTAVRRGDFARAAELQRSASERARGADKRTLVVALTSLGLFELRTGRVDEARDAFLESLDLAREAAEKSEAVATGVFNVGLVEVVAQRPVEAARWLAEAIELYSELGDTEGVAYCLAATASVAVARSEHARAATLLGASGSLLEVVGASLEPVEDELRGEAETAVRAVLTESEFEGRYKEGAALAAEAAAELGLGELRRVQVG